LQTVCGRCRRERPLLSGPDTPPSHPAAAADIDGNRRAPDVRDAPDDENDEDAALAFRHLGPDRLLDAIDAAGWLTDGRVAALNSYENRVYSVGLESGEFAVAKFYRPGRWSDESILEEHDFCAELVERDLPAVAPLANPDGETLFHAGPHRLALFPRVGGRPPELDDPEHLGVIGRTLGRLHLVGAMHDFEDRPCVDLDRLGEEPSGFLLDSPLLPDALVEVYGALTDELLDLIADRIETVDAAAIRVHGDFHPGNLLIGGDGTPWLLDFDDAGTGPAVQDLWMFLPGERADAQSNLGHLLEGYFEFRDFDRRELALIEPLRTLRIIHHAAWIARRWDDPAFRLGFPQFAEARFWDDHVLTLREQRAALDQEPLRY